MKTADKIRHIIKKEGSVTAKFLAEQFNMSTMGARQHLQALEKKQIIQFYDVKMKVGRPVRHWRLTTSGHENFIDRHNELVIQMLDAINAVFGQRGLQAIITERETKTLQTYRLALSHSTSLDEKLKTLVELREKEGYMVELEKTPDGYLLSENHCPICKAATKCQTLCQSELTIFNTLLGNACHIERQEHIASGQRRCLYKITPIL